MKEVYKTFISSDGFEILVGNQARDNDYLTFKVASSQDFWFHVAATPGAHVIVRNPDKLKRLPKQTLGEAASLAAYYSKSRKGGQVAVNYTQRQNVRKERGTPAGQVTLKEHKIAKANPKAEIWGIVDAREAKLTPQLLDSANSLLVYFTGINPVWGIEE